MFSASLISVLFHLVRPLEQADDRVRIPDIRSAANILGKANTDNQYQYYDMSVPVIVRSKKKDRVVANFGQSIVKWDLTELSKDGGDIVWGQFPLRALISYFNEYFEVPPEEEYFDIGTPVFAGAYPNTSFAAACKNLLAGSTLQSPTVTVAFVDEGRKAPGSTPEDFGGRLHHVHPNDIAMSSHATKVFWILLDRLKRRGILDKTQFYCALVEPSDFAVGPRCFTHANSPKLLTALKDLSSAINNLPTPVLINLSMGTHVGPHNGDSPLEAYVKTIPSSTAHRYLFVSAGNDGLSGVSGSRKLQGNVPDFMRVRVDQSRFADILIEFWWRQADGGDLSIDVEAVDDRGSSLMLVGSLQINSGNAAGVQLTQRTLHGSTCFSSLFAANCQNGMSCIAFAMSDFNGVSATEFDFTLTSQADVTVNAWIAVCSDRKASFIGSGDEGTLRVPSTLDEVICVAGVEANGNPWARSSRGPAVNYNLVGGGQWPSIAHLVDLGGEKGTSFASPRACADAAIWLSDSSHRKHQTAQSLVHEVLKDLKITPSSWDSRAGFGKVIT